MVRLFDDLRVGQLLLKNRIVLPPMHIGLAKEDGSVTSDLIDHYVKRAKHVGLVIVEHSYVSPKGKFVTDQFEKQLGIYKDELISGLKNLAESIQNEGTPVAIQISHAGARTNGKPGLNPVAPSQTEKARKLKRDEIQRIKNDFIDAANRAINAGFDAVEIHGAHGYLLNEFYSPLTNKRKDEYGRDFESRTRFLLEIVEKVNEKIGDKTLLYRLGSVDLDSEGIQIEESVQFAKKLEKKGLDIIDVSGGLCGARPQKLQGKQGYFIPQAREIKKAVDTPVIGVGGIKKPKYADKIIQEKSADLVAVGRAQLSDPEWASKAIQKIENKKNN